MAKINSSRSTNQDQLLNRPRSTPQPTKIDFFPDQDQLTKITSPNRSKIMPANVTAEHRVHLSDATYYLARCVCYAEQAPHTLAATARVDGALDMLSYLLAIPATSLEQLSSQAKEAAGLSAPDSHSEITLWLDRYTNHLADALYVALTPGN